MNDGDDMQPARIPPGLVTRHIHTLSLALCLALAGVVSGGRAASAQEAGAGATISEDDAIRIARETVEGEVMDVEIERKLGGERYVVEVIRAADGAEIDVIIEMETGKVLGTED